MLLRILKSTFFCALISVVSVLFFQNIVDFSTSLASARESSQPVEVATPVEQAVAPVENSVGLPVRILIPSLKVDAAIDRVGLTPDGSMGIPKIPRNAAWFNLGPRPGEIGSAAIAGHVNWWNGATAVFAKLNKLKPGDKIVIRDNKSNNITFVVRKSFSYGSKDDVADVFSSSDNEAHLNLITCSGVWNKRAQQYSKRLVVFSDRVME